MASTTTTTPAVKVTEGSRDDFLAPYKLSTLTESSSTLDVSVIGFDDKITVLVYTAAQLNQFFYVPLLAAPVPSYMIGSEDSLAAGPGTYDDDGNFIEDGHDDADFLPLPHLTPMPLLGANTSSEASSMGSIYAAQIASLIARQAPEDRRTVVVGLGPAIGPAPGQDLALAHRRQFLEIMKLVEAARVW